MSAEPLHKTLWQGNQALAEECLAHPFIRGLGDGSLDPEDFKHYVAQDAFFLRAFFSAYALGAVRAVEKQEVVQRLHGLMRGVLDELKLHQGYAESVAIDLGKRARRKLGVYKKRCRRGHAPHTPPGVPRFHYVLNLVASSEPPVVSPSL